jgi:putative ABC transport system permease protein
MMGRTALLALLSHYRRRPLQLVALILGLALATALWSGVQAINAEARSSYDDAARALATDRTSIEAEAGDLSEAQYVALRRAGLPVSPLVDTWIAGGEGRVRLLGVDPVSAPSEIMGGTQGAVSETGGTSDLLSFITPPGELLAAPATAARLTRDDLPPVVIAPNLAPGIVLADIGIAQGLAGMEGRLSRLIWTGAGTPRSSDLPDGLKIIRPDEAADLARLTDSFHLNLTAFGLLSFVVGLLIVHGAIGLAFEQRRPMFRTLRALGVPARTLMALTLLELTVLALISATLGMVMGYAIAATLLPDVAATLRGLYGAPIEGSLTLRPAWWMAGFGIALAGTLVAGAGTLWKIARLPVLAPARPRAWARAHSGAILLQAGAALGIAALALAAGIWGKGLLAGFVLLGGLLVAAALTLPLVLAFCLGIAERFAKGAEAQWFWADTRQQLPGLSLALMALLLALATNIGVGTMVESFRDTFTGWLDQRLVSELYVRTADEDEARRFTGWIQDQPAELLPIWHADADIAGQPGQIFGIADNPIYPATFPFIAQGPDPWARVYGGTGVLLNEQTARRTDLWPGDLLPLPGGALEIVGVYGDYGNPAGQAILSLPTLEARFTKVDRLRFGVLTNDGPELARAMVDDLGLEPEQITDQAALKGLSHTIFERTFAVTGALNVLTLGVAGVAIFTALLTLGTMRLPQLAPAWAIGLTRTRLAQLEVLRTLALAALTFVLAIPVGLMLAWLLLAVINVEAFGWRLPMRLFPGDWLRLGALATIAALLAGLWPALRLARLSPAALLRSFSNER